MEKKIFYVACDGRQFSEEEPCLEYEGVINAASAIEHFLHKDGCLLMKRYAYSSRYNEAHIERIEKEIDSRGLRSIIDSTPEIKEWCIQENFDGISSPLCKNCEFNCHHERDGYDYCQLFEIGGSLNECGRIKSTQLKDELAKIFHFCRIHRSCNSCPFCETETDSEGEEFQYCSIVALMYDLIGEIDYYRYGDFESEYLICLKD